MAKVATAMEKIKSFWVGLGTTGPPHLTAPLMAIGAHRNIHYIQLYSPHNMVAQANKKSKNTTNEIEKNDNSSTLYTYKLLKML